MELQIFSVYDAKAEAYLTPFFLHNEKLAIRVFTDCVNDPEHPWGKHPEDYILFHIGCFKDTHAEIISKEVPSSIARAWEIKPQPKADPTGTELPAGLVNLRDLSHEIAGDTRLPKELT